MCIPVLIIISSLIRESSVCCRPRPSLWRQLRLVHVCCFICLLNWFLGRVQNWLGVCRRSDVQGMSKHNFLVRRIILCGFHRLHSNKSSNEPSTPCRYYSWMASSGSCMPTWKKHTALEVHNRMCLNMHPTAHSACARLLGSQKAMLKARRGYLVHAHLCGKLCRCLL